MPGARAQAVNTLVVAKNFDPNTISLKTGAVVVFVIINADPTHNAPNARFTDDLPAGLVVANTADPVVTNTCTNGGVPGTVRAFRVHVDRAHLHGPQGMFELAVPGVALVAEPGFLVAPVDVVLRLPDVLAPAGEAHFPVF